MYHFAIKKPFAKPDFTSIIKHLEKQPHKALILSKTSKEPSSHFKSFKYLFLSFTEFILSCYTLK